MTRFPREYCPHCRENVWCVFKGPALYCQGHDHYVRARKTAKHRRPAPASNEGQENYYDLKYREIQGHINNTMRGRGYTWEELIIWATRTKFDDLASLCEDMAA